MTHLPKAVVPSKVRMLPILKMAYFQYSSKSQRSVQKICAWTRTGNVFGQWRMLLLYNRIGGNDTSALGKWAQGPESA
jgi:hypothetical protein